MLDIFVNNCFNKDFLSIFTKHLKLASAKHSYNTRSMRNGLLFIYTPNYFAVMKVIHTPTNP